MSEEVKMTLVQKLSKIREMVEVLLKNKKSFTGYYVPEDEILARIAAGEKKYGVFLSVRIVPGTLITTPVSYTKTKKDKAGNLTNEEVNEVRVQADTVYTWINCDDIEDTMEVPWAIVGQQGDTSQAFGSALTYANRYFMLKFFQVATTNDDPDNWREKKDEAEQEADMAIVRKIITKIDAHVRGYLSANKNAADARKAVSATIKKYVSDGDKPSADYASYLTDLDDANKLLADLQANFPYQAKENE